MVSLRKKLFILVSGMVLAVYILMAGATSVQMKRLINSDTTQTLNMLARQKVIEVNARMEEVERAVSEIVSYLNLNVDENLLKTDSKYMESFMDEMSAVSKNAASICGGISSVYFRLDPHVYGSTSGVFLVRNAHGIYEDNVPTDILKFSSNDRNRVGWFYEPKFKGLPIWMDPYYNKNIDLYMISYVVPVYAGGSFLGVVGMDMNMMSIQRMISQIDYKNGFAFLFNRNGNLVYHNDFPMGLSSLSFDDGLIKAFEYVSTADSKKDMVGSYKWKGEKHCIAAADMHNKMILAVSVPYSEIMRPYTRTSIFMALGFFFVLALIFFGSRHLMRHVVLPLNELTAAASRIARGELNVPIHYASTDEIGLLSSSIRKMAGELQEYISYVHKQAYTDSMTGVGNKAAYTDFANLMERKIQEEMADFAIIVFDVNGLKSVNDNFGHEAGDALISDAATAIKNCFGLESVYRIGGDEFVIIKENVTEEEMKEASEKFNADLLKINSQERKYQIDLSVSFGYAIFNGDENFNSLFHRADEEMYKAKELYYQNHNDRRRRR